MNERGRHRSTHGRSPWPIVAGAAVLVLAAGAAAWGVTHHSDDTRSAGGPTTSGRTSNGEGDTATATMSQSATSSSSPSRGNAALTACRSEVTAGQKFVRAADKSYAGWYDHVYAQVEYDNGKLSLTAAQKIWDDTKAKGPDDLKAYDGAKPAYDKARGDCEHATAGDGVDQSVVAACQRRATAIGKVADAAAPVYSQWKGHQKQMTHMHEKMHDPNAYYAEWHHRVAEAKQPLAKYKTASEGYQEVPACPGVHQSRTPGASPRLG